MKITLISVGDMREKPLKELADKFAARISHYVPFETVVIPDVLSRKNVNDDMRKAKEGDSILAKVSPNDFVILLDERGREMTSRQFAEFIEQKALSATTRNLILVIGGPYGFSAPVYERANMLIGLSKMTFTHEMARVFTLEQLYRAMTILRNEPYHHD